MNGPEQKTPAEQRKPVDAALRALTAFGVWLGVALVIIILLALFGVGASVMEGILGLTTALMAGVAVILEHAKRVASPEWSARLGWVLSTMGLGAAGFGAAFSALVMTEGEIYLSFGLTSAIVFGVVLVGLVSLRVRSKRQKRASKDAEAR